MSNGYDLWLERPYQEAYARQEAYERFVDRCHDDGIEPTDEDWERYCDTGEYPTGVDEYEPMEPDPDRLRDEWLERQYEDRYIEPDDVPF